ncbi:MAG: DUF4834 family protein [Prevotella sp.]|nr:DUF4834 family protein [Prevotella sp.]
MHFIAGFFFFIIFVFLIGLILIIYYVRKGMRFFRRMASGENLSDEEFQRRANKYYRKNNGQQFDDDYFQSTGYSEGNDSADYRNRQRRTTQTAGGVTIIDDRDPNQAKKKIFAHDEGDYVDFTES